ncbi:hypothetical protein BpHYR1_020352 [Brachionus plicatilis]|uniref:Uncharacterized protein n=1 Tax=Brachionus plicatilis TaxID=10195 RepID=A0A3M7QII9_BRAPC|nr:hypothetical protein BpHYR1_020352 [Brachionus plicatilis]
MLNAVFSEKLINQWEIISVKNTMKSLKAFFYLLKNIKISKKKNILFIPCGPSPPSSFESIIESTNRVESRSYIQKSEFSISFNWSAIIIINYIPDFFAASIHNPVVAIKWKFISHPIAHPSSWRVIAGFSAKLFKLRCLTLFIVQRFPLEHLLPSFFIVSIVDVNYVIHILLFDGVLFPSPAFSQHSIPKHLLRWILPLFVFGSSFGNCGGNSRC